MVTVVSGVRAGLGLLGWLLLCFGAAATGALFPPGEWYVQLNKPPWNPPGWLFGPVWTTLYIMMAVAAWLVWRRGGFAAGRWPLTLFIGQLALNALWTPLFFGLHSFALATVDMLLMLATIVATARAFRGISPVAGWLLVPYLLWVSFATILTVTLWELNR